jgi:hypothetical protein
MQQLRGRIYLEDGAVQESELTPSGRHVAPCDDEAWHLLTLRGNKVMGCIRFLRHPNTVDCHQLRVSNAALAHSDRWSSGFRHSIDEELRAARRFNFSYVEVGGWALAPEVRKTTEALISVLSIYALSQLQGGALGISTATERNGSASILQKLGGKPLEYNGVELPPYYEETYRCAMMVLRFDSRYPCERYASRVDALRYQMSRMPVVCPAGVRSREGVSTAFHRSLNSLSSHLQTPVPALA